MLIQGKISKDELQRRFLETLIDGIPDKADVHSPTEARSHPVRFAEFIGKHGSNGNGHYTAAWYHRLIGDDLLRVVKTITNQPVDRPIDRMIITLPPRAGKSELCTLRFPVWAMSEYELDIMVLTYGESLANEFGMKARDLVEMPNYRRLYPDLGLAFGQKSKKDWKLTNGARYMAFSLKGSVTGKGAKILILDDLYKNQQDADSATIREWIKDQYTSVAYTRLEPNAAVVACMTRWHHDDWTGWQMREFEDEGWLIRHLPAMDERN